MEWLYRSFASRLRWSPREVDELEVWEAARLLGIPDDEPVVALSVPARLRSSDGPGQADSLSRDVSRQDASG